MSFNATPMSLPDLNNMDIEGLTEQQAAEVVELLTPFLSPANTPMFPLNPSQNTPLGVTAMTHRLADARVFSPLTSPALNSTNRIADYSPRYHPYRQPPQVSNDFMLNMIANTNASEEFTLDSLATGTSAEASTNPSSSSRTLHQLSLFSSTTSSESVVTATPASLLNLPVSAHHLPCDNQAGNIVTQSAPMQSDFLRPPAPPPLQIDSQPTSKRRKSVTSTKRSSVTSATEQRRRQSTKSAILLSPRPTVTTTSTTSRVAASSTSNIVGLQKETEVVTRLATKSNYQNVMDGKGELLGLNYGSEFKSGLEKRRTNHKQAEQKRRDSLKASFERLKDTLPDPNDAKVVASKIYLLNRAVEYIEELKDENKRLRNNQ